MDASIFWKLLAVAFLVAANGFFVAAEFSLVTVRRTRIEQLAKQGNRTARVVRQALLDLDRYIAGTQVGITLASLALGWIGEPALATLLTPAFAALGAGFSEVAAHTAAIALAFIIITFFHVILGELVPKSLALQKPEATSLWVVRPLKITIAIFQPLIWALNGLGNHLLHLLGLHSAAGHESVHSAQELDMLVRESHKAGKLDDLEKRMLQRTLRFSETTVAEVMVSRADVLALDLKLPLEEILDRAIDYRRSRFPVFKTSIDSVEGVVYLHDLFRVARKPGAELNEVLRDPLFVPETLHLDALVEKFRAKNTQMAVVVDEYGGTAGLVTLEDIIEAVFGKFQDHDEAQTPEINTSTDGVITVLGETRLIEISEALGWNFKSDDVDTIGGYIMNSLGRVPKVGDEIKDGNWTFRVKKMERLRVAEVIATPNAKPH